MLRLPTPPVPSLVCVGGPTACTAPRCTASSTAAGGSATRCPSSSSPTLMHVWMPFRRCQAPSAWQPVCFGVHFWRAWVGQQTLPRTHAPLDPGTATDCCSSWRAGSRGFHQPQRAGTFWSATTPRTQGMGRLLAPTTTRRRPRQLPEQSGGAHEQCTTSHFFHQAVSLLQSLDSIMMCSRRLAVLQLGTRDGCDCWRADACVRADSKSNR